MRIQIDDIAVNIEITGTGHPIVLLHGAFCNTLLWQPQAELAESLNLVAIDLRGHGGTPCPVTARSFDRPFDVIKVMDSLNIDRAFFCGLSMGGPVAIQLSLDYPERCLGTILLATGPGPADRPMTATQEMKDDAETEAQRLMQLGPVEYFYSTPTANAPGVKEFLEQNEQRTFFERMLAHNTSEWLADSLRLAAVDVPPEMERLQSSRRVQRMQELYMPLLFMVGSLDQVFLPVAAFLKDKLPHCEVDIVPEATHLINIDSKEFVNSRILQFVDTVMREDSKE